MGYLQSKLFDLIYQIKNRKYKNYIDYIIYNMYIKNAFKSGKLGISLEKQSKITAKVIIDYYE